MLDVHRYHVKEMTIFLLLSVFVLCGCFDQTVVPDKGDFTFKVPKGYIISDITDSNCSIYEAEKSKMVGGIEITKLKLKDLKDENSSNIFRYLRQRFYGNKRMEQVTSLWGDKHPIVDIHLCVTTFSLKKIQACIICGWMEDLLIRFLKPNLSGSQGSIKLVKRNGG